MSLENKVKRYQIDEKVVRRQERSFLLREILIDTGKSRKELINEEGLTVEETRFNGDYLRYKRKKGILTVKGYNAGTNTTYEVAMPIVEEEKRYMWGSD